MPRSLKLISISTCALALICCLPGRAQDSPSLGDVARQAQKDKANKPTAKVYTNDDMSSGSGDFSPALGGGTGRIAQPGSAGSSGAAQSPAQMLERLQSALDRLDSLDRASLASDILEGNDSEFPGRAKWEEKLFAAKQTFVSQTRVLLQKARQLTASSEGIKDAQDSSDAHVKILNDKLDQLMQQAQQNSAAFQAVVAEGKALATQPPAAH
jgi:hypothetical protein